MTSIQLYELLVPTIYGDTLKPVRTAHHREWDKNVQAMAGGLTILHPLKGKWLSKGVSYIERVIPVRIACNPYVIENIARMTVKHYRQKSVMYYMVSDCVMFIAEN